MAKDKKETTKVDGLSELRAPELPTGLPDGFAADADACEHGQLIVKAAPEAGFNRAGFRFPHTEETVIPANSLSKARYEAIKNEKKLVVIEA